MSKIQLTLLETAFDRNYNDAEIYCTRADLPRTSYTWMWLGGQYWNIAITRSNPFEPTDNPNTWLATPGQLEQVINDNDMNALRSNIGSMDLRNPASSGQVAPRPIGLMERLDLTGKMAEGALTCVLELRERLEGVMTPNPETESRTTSAPPPPDQTVSIRRMDDIDRTIACINREILSIVERLVL